MSGSEKKSFIYPIPVDFPPETINQYRPANLPNRHRLFAVRCRAVFVLPYHLRWSKEYVKQ